MVCVPVIMEHRFGRLKTALVSWNMGSEAWQTVQDVCKLGLGGWMFGLRGWKIVLGGCKMDLLADNIYVS